MTVSYVKLLELLDHLDEFSTELGADLETGTHEGNNAVSADFAYDFKHLMAWQKKMADLRDEVRLSL